MYNWLILYDLVKMKDLPATIGKSKYFTMAGGTFTSDKVMKLFNAMLP